MEQHRHMLMALMMSIPCEEPWKGFRSGPWTRGGGTPGNDPGRPGTNLDSSKNKNRLPESLLRVTDTEGDQSSCQSSPMADEKAQRSLSCATEVDEQPLLRTMCVCGTKCEYVERQMVDLQPSVLKGKEPVAGMMLDDTTKT